MFTTPTDTPFHTFSLTSSNLLIFCVVTPPFRSPDTDGTLDPVCLLFCVLPYLILGGVFDDSLTHSHITFDFQSSIEEGYCQVLSWGTLYLMCHITFDFHSSSEEGYCQVLNSGDPYLLCP